MKRKKLILIVCVVVLSFAGVSYAAWTDSLKIQMLFSTGEVNVAFTNCELKTDRDKGDSLNDELDWLDAKIVNNVMVITGEVTPGFKGNVKYRLINNSTLPVKYLPEEKKQTIVYGGMTITLNEKETVIEPGESMPKDNGWSQFQIGFDRPDKYNYVYPERYDYNFYLPFVQYNLTSGGGWNEELRIHVDVIVVEESIEPELEMINQNAAEPLSGDVPETEMAPAAADTIIKIDQAESDGLPSDPNLIDIEMVDSTPGGSEKESVIDENVVNNTESDVGSEENIKGGEE